jgi:hypothetical protein
MATSKAAPAGKKTPSGVSKKLLPNPILVAAGKSVVVLLEPSIKSIALTVIAELQKQAKMETDAAILKKFLDKAYAAVQAGGGQEGGDASLDGPPGSGEKPLN